MVLSSAEFQMSEILLKRNKSFMNMLNSNGPKANPCGTPTNIFVGNFLWRQLLPFDVFSNIKYHIKGQELSISCSAFAFFTFQFLLHLWTCILHFVKGFFLAFITQHPVLQVPFKTCECCNSNANGKARLY